jgi:hypothetical protein
MSHASCERSAVGQQVDGHLDALGCLFAESAGSVGKRSKSSGRIALMM